MSLCLAPSPYVTPAATMATETDFLQFTGRRFVAMAIARCLAALVFSCSSSVGTKLFGSVRVRLSRTAQVKIVWNVYQATWRVFSSLKSPQREMIDVTHLVGWHVYFLGEPPIACCGSQLILKGAECRVSIWRKQIFMFLFCGVKRKKGRVGVKYEDWYTPLSAGGACREISLAYFSSYRSMWDKRFDLA